MVNFCNPGVLGTRGNFHKYFETPILLGREPDAAEEAVGLGQERSEELSALVNDFILRRTNDLLSKHLPPKVSRHSLILLNLSWTRQIIEIVCCNLEPLQKSLYKAFLASTAAKRLVDGNAKGALPAITALKKLCNHPKLIYDELYSVADKKSSSNGFEVRASNLLSGASAFIFTIAVVVEMQRLAASWNVRSELQSHA